MKTLGSLGKNRVGRVTGNTHISFFGLIDRSKIDRKIDGWMDGWMDG